MSNRFSHDGGEWLQLVVSGFESHTPVAGSRTIRYTLLLGSLSTHKDDQRSAAYDVNNEGHTVGRSQHEEPLWAPFLHTDELGMLNLEELTIGIPWADIDRYYLRGSWINDEGTIAGPHFSNYNFDPHDHPPKAFVLRRVYDEPPPGQRR
ncbi:MAG: hypothetical protein EA424_21995 [Planctomycetaceae bacterium]|nr:MAG: hypothetical protein EA424_21995 [Planctomycetaceae bacterium]